VQIDLQALRKVTEESYSHAVYAAHGRPGTDALRHLLEQIASIYRHVEPALLEVPLLVACLLDESASVMPVSGSFLIERHETIVDHIEGRVVIQLLHDGRVRLWNNVDSFSEQAWAEIGIVYTFMQGQETIFVKQEKRVLRRLATAMPSAFAMPTFTDLAEALRRYEETLARECRCKILAGVWEDGRRLHFVSKPEAAMRDSLTQFLLVTLRAEVRPEQNVDETQPVDIKVSWRFANRLALIEIKWLGDSRASPTLPVSTSYRDARARDGAKQLADYLDDNRPHAPGFITRGYLVVFDGRRRGINKENSEPPSSTEACYYRTRPIRFNPPDPPFHERRGDFEEPSRIYLEPNLGN
tara:strand:- start:3600 stop:4664 length:1065 start_codon:yes stop_codon:yes gene_type:complete